MSLTAFCTFKKLFDLGCFEDGNFSQNSTNLHIFGQISMAWSATDLLSAHLVAQKGIFYFTCNYFIILMPSWAILKNLPTSFRVSLMFNVVDSIAVLKAPWITSWFHLLKLPWSMVLVNGQLCMILLMCSC